MISKIGDNEEGIMHTKTMEGLIGARTNMNLMNTPMRVYKEARRKGDSETMERAMGYANECSDRAEEYKAEVDEGMKKDAQEMRRIAREQCKEAIQKRRAEREKLEKKIEENRNDDANTDTKETSACLLEISEEGKALLKNSTGLDNTVSAEPSTSISVSV
ncbi:MAG: hypothetical protein HDR71_07005 [Lachnospiraceae bacterium]|nr:hypothetical protein [Lachnospiraceae bacterium]